MIDKRSSARRDTVLYLRITHRTSRVEIGRLTDLSATGVLLITEQPLAADEPMEVCIHLPPRLSSERDTLCGILTPKWSKPDRNPRLSLSGCLFETAPEDKELRGYLIEEYGFNSGTIDFRKRYERSKAMRDEEI